MSLISKIKLKLHEHIEWWRRHPQLTALVVGQVLSLLITGTGVCSQLLASNFDVNIPTAQSLFNYVLLALVYGIIYFRKVSFWDTLKSKWFIYFPLAFVDVEANYFVVKAYQFTSITSVMLLDCFTIPCVMLFTFLILKTRYNWRHFVGVVLCLGGLTVLVFTDSLKNTDQSAAGPSPIFGDILCLVGAFLYGVSNTGQEISVKKWDRNEFLAMIGFFGAPINFIQLMILEREQVTHIGWNLPVIALVIGFAILLFAMYSLTPHMMVLSGSTLFNLSLLTSDAYAIIFGIFLFHKSLHWAYWIALAIIICGLCLYNIMNEPAQSELDQPRSPSTDATDEESLRTKQRDDDLSSLCISSSTPINDTTTTTSSEDLDELSPRGNADRDLELPIALDSQLTDSRLSLS